MRVDSVNSVDKTFITNTAGSQEFQEVKAPSKNEKAYLKDLPVNFQTRDPKQNKAISIGELELIEAIERANETLKGVDTNFKFSSHEETRAIMVKVINSETQEVIREIPPEKILDMVAKIWEVAGIMVDERR